MRTKRVSALAISPVGYADEYPRLLSNTGVVRLRNHLVPVIGRVSMNLLVVDATRTRVQPGDLAVLLGGKGRGLPIATELAERSGTIAYELTTRIAEHVPHRTI